MSRHFKNKVSFYLIQARMLFRHSPHADGTTNAGQPSFVRGKQSSAVQSRTASAARIVFPVAADDGLIFPSLKSSSFVYCLFSFTHRTTILLSKQARRIEDSGKGMYRVGHYW